MSTAPQGLLKFSIFLSLLCLVAVSVLLGLVLGFHLAGPQTRVIQVQLGPGAPSSSDPAPREPKAGV